MNPLELITHVDRKRLDFDFEKVCSVTLCQTNVYACLCCGRYLQGRSSSSPAHQHFLQENHPLFINLQTLRIYSLASEQEIVDISLDDIKFSVFPTFTAQDIARMYTEAPREAHDLHGRKYLPGLIGLNNLKANDYANVCIQALAHVGPLRDFFLLNDLRTSRSALLRCFGEVIRKLCNPMPFKAHVSPHTLLQAINVASNRRYTLAEQGDPFDLMAWLLNTLCREPLSLERQASSKNATLITHLFQGQMQISTKRLCQDMEQNGGFQVHSSPFFLLGLEIPPMPLYQSANDENLIPQVSLQSLLEKYDGSRLTHSSDAMRAFSLERLPPFLLLHLKRFVKTNYLLEKNRTLITFPLVNLPIPYGNSEVAHYDLLANICHQGEPGPGKGEYFIQICNRTNNRWYEMRDIEVKELAPTAVPLADSYLQIWQRR